MGLAVHRSEVEKLLEEWADNPKEAGNMINCLVEFMAGDLYWLGDNIRKTDREGLIELARILTPNAPVTGRPPAEGGESDECGANDEQ